MLEILHKPTAETIAAAISTTIAITTTEEEKKCNAQQTNKIK